MLDDTRRDRPQGVKELERDIRRFHNRHTLPIDGTRQIRDAFFCHSGKTSWLEVMWEHVIHCEHCLTRLPWMRRAP